MPATYRISVHEQDNPIRPEHQCVPGWIEVECRVPWMGLRAVVQELRDDGYDDEAILVEREEMQS